MSGAMAEECMALVTAATGLGMSARVSGDDGARTEFA